jgi:LmbE family N-acetylglucosaminyl deacetylase
MSQDTTRELLPEDWERALAVVAHPDDIEYGAAAAIARWTAQGKDIVYCMVTSGEAGIDGLHPDESGPLREAEEIASARVVGVDQVEFLREPDGVLEYGVHLRRRITEVVRRHRPDIVITLNHHENFAGGNLNQADHVAVGRAVIDAVRDAGNRWIFTEQVEDGLAPWGGVRAVWVSNSPCPTHAIDVSDTFTAGVASLEEHKAYIEGLGWEGWDAEEFLDGILRQGAQGLGVTHAATFEVFEMGWKD